MLENQDMSAPIKLAEGYNPFGDEDVAPQQAQPAVEVAPTVQDEPNSNQQQVQNEQQEIQTSFDVLESYPVVIFYVV